MEKKDILPRSVHFVGVGGIGVSALAQWYVAQGARVSGSDAAESPVTARLEKKGVAVTLGHRRENVPEEAALLVYSDAVPEENSERAEGRRRGIPEQSYFEALGEVVRRFPRVIAVAGTHGKTTTTAMVSLALREAGVPLTAFVGSLVPQFPEGSNVLLAGEAVCVVEACEYRDHLLHLSPTTLVVTNLEWDHTDWFSSLDDLRATMRRAAARLPAGGALVYDAADEETAFLRNAAGAGVALVDYRKMTPPPLKIPGAFNAKNAQAAYAASCLFAAEHETAIRKGLSAFRGVWRRFEYKGMTPKGAAVYDDYAHHPTAVRETLRAARALFPRKRVLAVFQPHLYSRTRDLFEGFVEALATADTVRLLPIYAAREKKEDFPGVSSEALARALAARMSDVRLHPSLSSLEHELREVSEETLVFLMGAGDLYRAAVSVVQER